MFAADVEGMVPEKDRLRRLSDSISFAQDLYAQRAALEAPVSSDLLQEEIGTVINTEPDKPFAKALAAIVETPKARRTAS